MRNPVCEHCKYKRAFCWFFRCDVYYEAQMKKAERRFYRNFLEDFNAEDRYTASLMFGWALVIFAAILIIFMGVKGIRDWWMGW